MIYLPISALVIPSKQLDTVLP